MTVSVDEIRNTVTPLRLVFWGGLLCVLDFSFSETANGEGWKCDILNDFVGMVMITWAVFRLAGIKVNDRYAAAMVFVKVTAVLSCVDALHDHFIYPRPPALSFVLTLLGAAAMVATLLFCLAMRWLSMAAGLWRSAKSWGVSAVLFTVIYVVPLGLFYLAAAVAIATESSFHIELGAAGLLLLPVFFIPLIHLFVSTSRMKNEAESTATVDGLEP